MTLAWLLDNLPPTGLDGLVFPPHLLGAFRRKSITFFTGLTDEQSIVYWFQSRSFTIDLRLPDGAVTPVTQRQGWCGDTLWDNERQELSWRVERGYQPRNPWPEPARLSFMGNCVIEFAPSGAYVEDWRQQCTTGPLLGLRLVSLRNETTGHSHAMEGGLILAGTHVAYAQSRLPEVDAALGPAGTLEQALAEGWVTERDIESCEISVALDGEAISHSTQPHQLGGAIAEGDFTVTSDGGVVMMRLIDGIACQLHFTVDAYVPAFKFGTSTPATPAAQSWLHSERHHLERHARFAR